MLVEPIDLYIQGLKIFRSDVVGRITLKGITILIGGRGSGKSTVLEALRFLGKTAWLVSKHQELSNRCVDDGCCLKYECYELLTQPEPSNTPIPEFFNKFQAANSVVVALSDSIRNIVWGVEILRDETAGKKCPYKIHEFENDDKHTKEIFSKLETSLDRAKINAESVPLVHVASSLRTRYMKPRESTAERSGLEDVLVNGIGTHGEYLYDLIEYADYIIPPIGFEHIPVIWRHYKDLAEKLISKVPDLPERAVTKIGRCYDGRLCVTEETTSGERYNILFDMLSFGSRNLLVILVELAVAKYVLENTDKKVIIGFEEPEIALHSSTLTALTELMTELVIENQNRLYIVITTHSPKILLPLLTILKEQGRNKTDVLGVYHLLRVGMIGSEIHEVNIGEIPVRLTPLAKPYLSLHELRMLEKLIEG